jgi:hypothetical protein
MPDEEKNPVHVGEPGDEPGDDTVAGAENKAPAAPASAGPPNILTRPTDRVARPGFRNPPNQKSKAQKKQKKKS